MTSMEVSFNTDDDGFLSHECPSCEMRFKVRLGSGSSDPIGHCPYCQHDGEDCWWTPEQADYLGAVAARELIEPALGKMASRVNRSGGGLVKMTMSVQRSAQPTPPAEDNDHSPLVLFTCCGETIRHYPNAQNLRCIICGASGTAQPTTA
jgi:hypothetical protein